MFVRMTASTIFVIWNLLLSTLSPKMINFLQLSNINYFIQLFESHLDETQFADCNQASTYVGGEVFIPMN